MAAVQEVPPLGTIATRSLIQQNNLPYVANTRQILELQRTGFMLGLNCVCVVNVTMPASGTFTPVAKGPENFIKNMELGTNNGATFYRTDGFANYIVQRMQKPMDYKLPVPTFLDTNVKSRVYSYPQSPSTSTTFDVRFPVDLRNVLGEKDLNSLILMEGEQVITLAVTWGGPSDIYGASGSPITINSVSLQFEADTMILPRGVNSALYAANVSPIVQTLQETRDLNVGPYRWYPRQRGGISQLAFWIESSAGAIKAQSFWKDYQINFGNTSTPVRGTFDNKLAFDMGEQDGMCMPEGVQVFDFLMGNGDKRMPSTRDGIRVADGDDVYFEFGFTAAPTAGDKIIILTRILKDATLI